MLTSKNLLMHVSSMTPLLQFLAYEVFKTWKYVADSNTHVCLCIQAICRFCLVRLNWQKSAKSWLS